MKKIAVIGAGITGMSTAFTLAQKGYEVTVYDKNRYAAMETSFANGGQLSASNAEVWTRWQTIFKGLKWMMKSDAPLLVNPAPSLHKLGWMYEFMRHIPDYEDNTVRTAELAVASRDFMTQMAEDAGIEFNRVNQGILHFYDDEAEFAHAHYVTDLLARGGVSRTRLTPEEVYHIEPSISSKVIGGYYTESDFTGDIHKFSTGLVEACGRLGVRFFWQHEVIKLSPNKGAPLIDSKTEDETVTEIYDGVVICAGVRSRDFAAQAGDRVNIYPVKGYSITISLEDDASRAAAPWVSLLDDKAKIVTSRLGEDRFRVAGTAEFNGYNYNIRADRIAPMTRWVEKNFTGINTEYVTPWAGLRPMMPNMMPRIGSGRAKGIFYNTGHGHLGWTLSCVSAHMVTDVILAADNQ
ncbi:MAG: D-amino acid dehydrogenase [Candidatus Puniceispirillaceae bacterium]